MQKFEITVSPDYVAKWTIVDAIRELLQNAIDAEADGHPMYIDYCKDTQELTIRSVGAKLDISSLLLGSTSKANDKRSIGQFGEGYKIATLVLLRNDKQVVFSNGLAKETWRPRFIKSKRFGCNVLGFFIEKWGPFSANANELVVSVQDITPEEYENKIKPSALILRDDWEVVEHTPMGDILNIPGAVFVNGLYVREHQPYKYGYNFKPEYLELDRDRKLVSDFDLEWLASRMWSKSTDTAALFGLIRDGAADAKYITNNIYGKVELYDYAWREFISKYGSNAVPITTQEELEKISKDYRPIVVSQSIYNLVTQSSEYVKPETINQELFSDRFRKWYDDNKLVYIIPSDVEYAFNNLVNELEASGN